MPNPRSKFTGRYLELIICSKKKTLATCERAEVKSTWSRSPGGDGLRRVPGHTSSDRLRSAGARGTAMIKEDTFRLSFIETQVSSPAAWGK